ncbi:SDR family oxidoreductase [Arthrobacter methylotrophus]|uniref:SDR family oxidoreductase n=1 Tax=Arthrobacter methylotrophus TaxID=121291 RepID=A0ABV5USN5_9MICC
MKPLAVVLGSTGYIGGRLVPRLLEAGYDVRVLVRHANKLTDVPWASRVEVVTGDLEDADSLRSAFVGADVIYYLVHSMGPSGQRRSFAETERLCAGNVGRAAADAGAGRIIYLGGLHPEGAQLSKHLRSRKEVGDIFLNLAVPAVVLQAGVVIGSGSASFEMIRQLTEVLPIMVAPRWVRNKVQPIAIRDVLYYLVAAAGLPASLNRAFDIGGPDVLRYDEMMNGYAAEAGLRYRPVIALPVLTPWLASQWVNLVTPIPRSLAVPLIGSLQQNCVVGEPDIHHFIDPPEAGLLGYRQSLRLALAREGAGEVETSWQNSSVRGAPSDPLPSDPQWAGHLVYQDNQEQLTTATRQQLWQVIEGIGGDNGWYSFPLAWSVRGWLDKIAGGVGLRRGRLNPTRLNTGDALDFWRVEQIDRGSLLRLRAEMKVPGRAWLEMRADEAEGGALYRQRAVFFPKGLGGRLYWLAVLPFHGVIFKGMANRITAAAASMAEGSGTELSPSEE